MEVGPGNLNETLVTESVTEASFDGAMNNCPSTGANGQSLFFCSGNSTFTVGPASGGTEVGTYVNGPGDNQFWDYHLYALGPAPTYTTFDVLSAYAQNWSCTQTCSQTYSACGMPLSGEFTITATFTHSSINGTPVTIVSITEDNSQ